jgi:hypothetical protein
MGTSHAIPDNDCQSNAKHLDLFSDGYDVCYVTIPERSLGDAQVNAEYVAYNIEDLAAKSSTGTFELGQNARLAYR